MKELTAIDYATSVLVNKNFDRLEEMFQSIEDYGKRGKKENQLHVLSTVFKKYLDVAALEADADE